MLVKHILLRFTKYHCIVFLSSIYSFWLTIWYLPTLLNTYSLSKVKNNRMFDLFLYLDVKNMKFANICQNVQRPFQPGFHFTSCPYKSMIYFDKYKNEKLTNEIKRRYPIKCIHYVSGTTVIRYAHIQKIGMANNLHD